jgi:hypothetical protein
MMVQHNKAVAVWWGESCASPAVPLAWQCAPFLQAIAASTCLKTCSEGTAKPELMGKGAVQALMCICTPQLDDRPGKSKACRTKPLHSTRCLTICLFVTHGDVALPTTAPNPEPSQHLPQDKLHHVTIGNQAASPAYVQTGVLKKRHMRIAACERNWFWHACDVHECTVVSANYAVQPGHTTKQAEQRNIATRIGMKPCG